MSKWNIFDKTLAEMRCGKIKKYIPNNKSVCDIGCGQSASFLKSIRSYCKECVGIDKYIKNSEDGNLKLINENIEDNIWKENTRNDYFDVVTMIAVIEHLEKVDNVIKNINLILKSNGTIIMTTPTKECKPLLEFLAFKLKIINKDEILEHKHYYDEKELTELLINNGFNVVKYRKFQFGLNQYIVAEKQ